MRKLLLLLFVFNFSAFVFLYPIPYTLYPAYADARCDPATCTVDDEKCLNDVKAKCEEQIRDAQNQEKTLQSQLNLIDGQTKVTQLKIEETDLRIEKLKREINDLSTRMDRIGTTLDKLSEILLNQIIQTYKYSNVTSAIDLLFSSRGFSDLLERLKYIQVAQAYDKEKLYELQATKLAYNDQKQDKQTRQAQAEKLNKDLENYKLQLAEQKKAKDELLKVTQNDEVTYQKLLAQAQAQLAGFQRFTQGHASILTGQTSCDDWGCYYNQRDSQWGNLGLNNTSYSIADVGCLVTSMAMVYTHYGHRDVTPLSISSNSDNFSPVAPTYLKYVISANGTASRREGIAKSIIDSELSAGRPIIIGIGGGPDHFIVFVSGSNGNYKMNDPFVPNGRNINFTDHYSLSSISEIDKVNF